jgi:hypothetical protein
MSSNPQQHLALASFRPRSVSEAWIVTALAQQSLTQIKIDRAGRNSLELLLIPFLPPFIEGAAIEPLFYTAMRTRVHAAQLLALWITSGHFLMSAFP